MRDMYRCGSSLRHVALRYCSEGGKLRMPVAKNTMILFERAVVHEPAGLEGYTQEVRDLACTTLEPAASKWCMSSGESVESKALNSHLLQIPKFRCQVTKMLQFATDGWNATLHLSPYKNCVSVITEVDLAEGAVIIVNEVVQAHEPIDSIDSMKQRVDLATTELKRWESVGVHAKVVELSDLRGTLVTEMLDALMQLEESPTTFFCEAHVDPQFLPVEPPVLTKLDCEQASDLLDIRARLGVRDVKKSLLEALEMFKKC